MPQSVQPFATRLSATLLAVALSTSPGVAFAHAGHGDEFQGDGPAAQSAGAVQIDRETARRMGIKVEPVRRQALAFGIKATGQLEALPDQTVAVTTPVRGTVIQLLARPGDAVTAGQPVAVMTSPELAEQRTTALDRRAEGVASMQQAQADLRLAQQNLAQQQRIMAAEMQQAQTEVRFAQERYDTDRELLANGAIPRRTVLDSETKLAEARAALAKAESGLAVAEARAQLQRAQSAVEVARSRVSLSAETYQTRLRQLGATPNADGTITIPAPISGIVADREMTQGESGEDAGKKVMTLINGRRVQVSANIYEKDLAQVQTGQRVRVRAKGIANRWFEGRINVLGAVVDSATRAVPIKVILDNGDGTLKPGMFVELEVLTERTPAAVLAIPKAALVETTNQQPIVFVQNGNTFEPAEVTLGRESGAIIEIKRGLFDGDHIVTQGAPMLYAQSLRGGSPVADDGSDAAPSTEVAHAAWPWWGFVVGGGAIAATTFWLGMYWAKTRQKAMAPAAQESDNNGSNDWAMATQLAQNGSSPPSGPSLQETQSLPPDSHEPFRP